MIIWVFAPVIRCYKREAFRTCAQRLSLSLWRSAEPHFLSPEGWQVPDLFDDIVEEYDLGELHGEVVLVGARLQVADHRGSYAEGRHQEAGEEEVGGGARLRVHQQQRHVLLGNPLEQVQHHQRVQIFLQGEMYSLNTLAPSQLQNSL